MNWGFAAKAFYFTYFATTAAVLPYLILSYEALDLSGGQIGTLTGLYPLALFVGIFFWGALADLLQRLRLLLTVMHAGALLGVLRLTQDIPYSALLVSVGLLAFCFGAVIPIVDSAIMTQLEDRKSRYGRFRVWGVVGYGGTAPLVGLLAERYGLQSAFWVAVVFIVVCYFAANEATAMHNRIASQAPLGAGELLDRRWLTFLSLAFAGGLGLAVSGNYVLLYLSQLGASRTIIGLSLTAATLSELPFTLLGSALLRRLAPPTLLLSALTMLGVRLLLYPLGDSVAWVIGVQLLHGATFSIILIAGVAYADILAPVRLKATAQGLFSATTTGLGGATGGLVGGLLYGYVGVAAMFSFIGVAVLIAAIALLIVMRRAVRIPV